MLSKLSLIAVTLPLVCGLQIFAPERPMSQGDVTIKWASDATDVTTFSSFSIYLINEVFHDSFAIANNVDPTPQQLALTLPVVPARDGYTVQATNVGNITDVYAKSPSFSIAENNSTSSTASGTSSNTASKPPTSSTASVKTTGSATTPIGSASNSGSAPSDTSTPSSFNSGADATRPLGLAAFGFSVLAGVALMAF